jgi:hypothetical protein
MKGLKMRKLVLAIIFCISASLLGQSSEITIYNPEDGQQYSQGASIDIFWDYSGNENVKIELYENNSFHSTIVQNTENDILYVWYTPDDLQPSNQYKIKITSTINSSIYGFSSGYFSIVDDSFPIISINIDVPDIVGAEYITATINMSLSTTNNDDVYMDVSFPDLIDSIKIIDYYDFDESYLILPGEQIYHRNGTIMNASDHLASALSHGYQDGDELSLSIRIYPSTSGIIPIYYRGNVYDQENNLSINFKPDDEEGDETDQQGWPVFEETVEFHKDLAIEWQVEWLTSYYEIDETEGLQLVVTPYYSSAENITLKQIDLDTDSPIVLLDDDYDVNVELPSGESYTSSIFYFTSSQMGDYPISVDLEWALSGYPDWSYNVSETIVNVEEPVYQIEFANVTWNVKGVVHENPDNNYWCNSSRSVMVDEDGQLHLKARSINGRWYCSEIWTDQFVDYDHFTFYVASNVDEYDQNAVAAMFLRRGYDGDEAEIDIEFSKWGNPNETHNGWYVVHRPESESASDSFALNLDGDYSTHKIEWSEGNLYFQSYYGHYPDMESQDLYIHDWSYPYSDFPENDNIRLHFSLWLYGANPPTDGQEVDFIVSNVVSPINYISIEDELGSDIPLTFDLKLNYPNPFNPSTTIPYAIARPGQIDISIYNITGQKVVTLESGFKTAGDYKAVWDATGFASGVYLVRLSQGKQHAYRKILLVK